MPCTTKQHQPDVSYCSTASVLSQQVCLALAVKFQQKATAKSAPLQCLSLKAISTAFPDMTAFVNQYVLKGSVSVHGKNDP